MGFPETRCCSAVFSSEASALDGAKAAGEDNPKIEVDEVRGNLTGRTVYAAHVYERRPDMWDLLRIYSDYDTGKREAGEPNMVTQHTLDPEIKPSPKP
jgi:hypothetical protein